MWPLQYIITGVYYTRWSEYFGLPVGIGNNIGVCISQDFFFGFLFWNLLAYVDFFFLVEPFALDRPWPLQTTPNLRQCRPNAGVTSTISILITYTPFGFIQASLNT